ncbi:MAG: FGGY family carbohydrate kinase [Eubacteriales bacterium]|nr:FGGY family carbohydrate kinase [Eubacteriales bacterium]
MKKVVAIDQSTSGTKVALMDENARFLRCMVRKHAQFYPAAGYVEHDAEEIWQNTVAMLRDMTQDVDEIVCLGIANQRETTVLWERASGKPVHPAIVWQDVRAKALTDRLAAQAEAVRQKTGLQLSPYYSAAKAAAVLDEHPLLRQRAEAGELCMGTIDSYLLYRLTAGRSFCTDVSNAARTQLLNLHTLCWDDELLALFRIPRGMLADRVLPSDSLFGEIHCPELALSLPITALMGDSNASFFGHGCLRPGMAKSSYGTGSSLMMNIGTSAVLSQHGLSTSVGFGCDGRICYVLEGNITCSADTLSWLRDEVQLISDVSEIEPLASSVAGSQGVYLVPAFSGLGAPYFDENARGLLFGMNRGTTRAHLLHAALASIAHQNTDILDAMKQDTGKAIAMLNADGGGSVNATLMQLQSDLANCAISVTAEKDLTLRGVGLMAGRRAGLYRALEPQAPAAIYQPRMPQEERARERAGWADAVRRCR